MVERGEITVLVDGHVQWRFTAHRFDNESNAVITERCLGYPPVPIGADLLRDGTPFGTVTAVLPEQFQRWQLLYEPVDAEALLVETQVDADEKPAPISLGETTLRSDLVSLLAKDGLLTVDDVRGVADDQLLGIKGVGQKSLADIKLVVAQYAT